MINDYPPWTVIHALAGTGPFRGSRGRMASPSDSSCLRDFGSVSRTRYHGVWRGGRSRRGERNQQQEADERRHRHGMAHLLQHRHDRRVLRTKVCLSSALFHCARAFIVFLFIVHCKSFMWWLKCFTTVQNSLKPYCVKVGQCAQVSVSFVSFTVSCNNITGIFLVFALAKYG